jgi:RNA polymerase sigma-70 factor (ECF subfamily)
MSSPLVEAFSGALEPELVEQLGGGEAEFASVLSHLAREASDKWPAVAVSPEDFAAYLGARMQAEPDLLTQLRAVRASDLFLACGCMAGDRKAFSAFEAEFGPDIVRAVRKVGSRRHAPEDLEQRVREKLFVGDGERPPKITAYGGQGSLRAWVRVTAVRTVLDVVRWGDDSKRKVDMESDMLEALPDVEPSPELAAFRKEHAQRLPAAMREAFATLSPRQRNLLRHRYLHGLSTERVANMYSVHRATAFRWLEAARKHLFERTREIMLRDLSMSGRELESFIAALRSRLDVSINGLLPSEFEEDSS